MVGNILSQSVLCDTALFCSIVKSIYKGETIMEREIERLLYRAGVLRTYVGYAYFVEAVRLVSEEPARHLSTCKEIYIPIAQEYNVDPRTVERNLRTIRDVFMRNNGKEILHDMGYDIWNERPGVRELIELFAVYLRNFS
jgi:hypothetical protein